MEWGAKRRRTGGNDGTAGGASSTDPSTEGQEAATSWRHDYEVFLSFRGPDTREGFTDFLYRSLKRVGIRTFRDDDELPMGEKIGPELFKAIEQSKILMPIFSKGYASSEWCLNELVRMVECQENGRQKIMPIFYDVAPSEVRWQTGKYKEVFHSHEEQYDRDTICKWKAALSAVAAKKGWNLLGKTTRQEGEFAEEVTEEVFRELKQAYLVVSDHLVSVDNDVDAIMKMIGAPTSETQIIGIHGMGGIGKTTIAKIIYNQLSSNFKDCCFLANIRETSEHMGITCLQNQLISDILKVKQMHINNIDEGIVTIKRRLSNKRVLLLLDDVEKENHIDALVGKRDWFGRESKIIITTRKKDILYIPQVDHTYELSVMDDDRSLQLFRKHAFRGDSPLDGDMDRSIKAIRIAGGLPLALEVIGSFLCRIKKENWDGQLKEWENVPPQDVMSKLKISYNALSDGQKHIFLDIACLFIGYDKDIVVHFWDVPRICPEAAIGVLQNMSLIKIIEDNKVWMHDQLRDLGREIVRKKSKTNLKEQRRVWDPKEGLDLLWQHKGKKKVEALRLKLDNHQKYRFSYEGFENLSYLRFFEVDGSMKKFCAEERLLWPEAPSNVFPTNENSYLLPQLRWLSWRGIPPNFNITNFSVDNMVILNLSRSKITDDWKGWSHVEVMKNLKVLDMSNCQGLQRTPNFSTLSNLKRLILRECISLIEIDRSIFQLPCLASLDVSYCKSLQRLPDELGDGLTSLKYLSLTACKSLERLPDSIGSLKSLIMLNISYMSIKKLPHSIRNLEKLKVVKMHESRLSEMPDGLWLLGDLEEITAVSSVRDDGRCLHVQIGNDGICGSQSLRILNLINAEIYALPGLPGSLVELALSMLCMDTFPDFSNLTNLKKMNLRFRRPHNDEISNGLGEHPMPRWIGNLSKLESLILYSHHVTTSPLDLSLPPQLKSLNLNCPNLRSLPRLPSSLSDFCLLGCLSHCSMEDLPNLKKLSSLNIFSSTALAAIQGLGFLENLHELALYSLQQVEILPDLSNLNKLTSLVVSFCCKLVEIQGQLPQFLDSFNVVSCGSLQKLPDLSSSIRLRNFSISHCCNLVEIPGELPQSLEVLKIGPSCQSLQRWPCFSSLMKLRELFIGEYDNLVEIQGKLPQSLEKLRIYDCVSLQKLHNLSSLIGLREFSIGSCDNLVEIQGELPQSLEVLDIFECQSLQELPLSSLKGLRKVKIIDCQELDVKKISSLCSEMSIKFVEADDDDSQDVEVDNEYDFEEDG